MWLVLIPSVYWGSSYVLTREGPGTFFSIEFMRRDGALFVSLLPMAALAALPLDRDRLARALILYLAFQAAIALVGGVGAATGWHSAFYRPAELVDHKPTFFGLYIAHNATASAYVLFALGAFAWSLRPENAPGLRTLLWILTALLTLGCVLARSRGAFLALGSGMLFVVVLALKRGAPRRLVVPAIAGLALASVAGGAILLPRFVNMLKQGSDKDRRTEWSKSVGLFKQSPVVGIGFGRYNDQQREYSSIGIGEVATKAIVYNDDRHAHNSYLHWLAEGGALGLAVMILFWIAAVRGLRGDDPLRDWILVGIVAMAVLSLTEHYAGGGVFLTHLAFLIGVRQARDVA